VTVRLAYFAPAHDLTPDLGVKYAANHFVVTRLAPVSESNTADTIDMLRSVNGIPVAVVAHSLARSGDLEDWTKGHE
jgi:type I restriction enzyme R subunit